MIDTTNTHSMLLTSADLTAKKPSNFLARACYKVEIPPAIQALKRSSLHIVDASDSTSFLGKSFQPAENDVVLGRGKGFYNRPGNKRFREIVCQHMSEYQAARTKLDKSMILNGIIDRVRQENNGRFVKNDKKKGGWIVIDDGLAREKVGHAMREAIAAKNGKESELSQRKATTVNNSYIAKQQSILLAHQQQFFADMMELSMPLPSSDITSSGTTLVAL